MNRYAELGLSAAASACVLVICLAYITLGAIEIRGGDMGMGIVHIAGILFAVGMVLLYVRLLRRRMGKP